MVPLRSLGEKSRGCPLRRSVGDGPRLTETQRASAPASSPQIIRPNVRRCSTFLQQEFCVCSNTPAWKRNLFEETRRGGSAVLIALLLFWLSEVLYSATYAALARARVGPFPQVGLGWYAVVLTPAVLAVGCIFGRPIPHHLFLVVVVLSLLIAWWLDLGVLPSVYSGVTRFNGANASLAVSWPLISSPAAAMRIYESVGLVPVSAALLTALWLAWQAAVAFGIGMSLLSPFRHR